MLAPVLRHRFLDANCNPLSGGLLYTYQAGTSTPKATYVDKAETPNTNPIVLDSEGYCDLWLGVGFYKFIIKDSDDVELWSVDQVAGGFTTPSGDATFNSIEANIIIMNGVNLDRTLIKVHGSYASPIVIDASLNKIPDLTEAQETKVFCLGFGGAVDISGVAKQIPDGLVIGQRIVLIGASDTNTITMNHGNNLYTGGAKIILGERSTWAFTWDGTLWSSEYTNGL